MRAGADLLARFAGSYEPGSLLAHPPVKEALVRVAGQDLGHVERNLGVSGPVDLVSGWLVVSGNAPHAGTEEEAVVCVLPEPLEVQVAIFSAGAVRVLADADSYEDVSLCIKDWITQVNSLHRDRLTQPGNVAMVGRQRRH